MKKLIIQSVFFIFCSFLYSSTILENFVITSLFGDSRTDHFHTGLDLWAIEEPIKMPEDGEVVFFNSNRINDFKYGNGEFVIVHDYEQKYAYNFSHILEGSFDKSKLYYQKGEVIALTGNTGRSTGYHLHLEVEDLKEKRLLNPISLFPVEDTLAPIIEDVFFVTMSGEVVSLFKSRQIIRGGRLFIKTYDRMNTTHFRMIPYTINVFINGETFFTLTFSGLDKINNDLFVSKTGKNFYNVYSTGNDSIIYLKEKYFLPGLYGIKVEVIDFAGNIATINTSFRVILPKQ